jgi:hypothetical protein
LIPFVREAILALDRNTRKKIAAGASLLWVQETKRRSVQLSYQGVRDFIKNRIAMSSADGAEAKKKSGGGRPRRLGAEKARGGRLCFLRLLLPHHA